MWPVQFLRKKMKNRLLTGRVFAYFLSQCDTIKKMSSRRMV